MYCRDEAGGLWSRGTAGQLDTAESRDVKVRSSPAFLTSSLLLGSLSPYLSADDSIDALLLPDVEAAFSRLHLYI